MQNLKKYIANFLVFCTLLAGGNLLLIETAIYAGVYPNIGLSLRLAALSAFVIYLLLFKRLAGFCKQCNHLLLGVVFSILVFSFFRHVIAFEAKPLVASIILSSAYIMSHSRLILNLLDKKAIWNLSILAIFLALIPPLATNKYLNHESNVSIRYSEIIDSNKPDRSNKVEFINIPLSPVEYDLVKSNIVIALSHGGRLVPPFPYPSEEKGLQIELRGARLPLACMLGHYGKEAPYFYSIETCLQHMAIHSKLGPEGILKSFDLIPFAITADKIAYLYNAIGRMTASSDPPAVSKAREEILGISYTGGGYFHHYQSFIRSQFDNVLRLDNQYGIGPVILLYGLTNLLDLTAFDATYVLALTSIAFVFVMMLFFNLSSKHTAGLTLLNLSLLTSICLIYFGSNMMAPMLYPIRMLPSIIIVLFLYHSHTLANSSKRIPWYLLLLISIWNFEYAILTLFALILADGFKHRSEIIRYFAFMLFSILLKFFTRDNDIVSTGLFSYFFGIGLPSLPHLLVILFLLIVFILTYILLKRDYYFSLAEKRIAFITIFLSIKFAWNGAFNHIGFSALMVGVLSALIIESKLAISYKRLVASQFIIAFIAVMVFSVNGALGFNLNSKILGFDYVDTKLSEIFKVESVMVDKAVDFERVVNNRQKVLLFSPIDNFLMTYVNRQLTGNRPDLSTNLYTRNLVPDMIKEIGLGKIDYIVVDKVIFSFEEITLSYEHHLKLSSNVSTAFHRFSDSVRKFRDALNEVLLSDSFVRCDESRSFLVYCRAKK